MALVDDVIRYLKGKLVVVVTSLENDGYQQEIMGTLLDGGDDCLVLQQGDDSSPTIINTDFVAWVYEEIPEGG